MSAPFFSSNSIAAFLFGQRELTARCYKIKQQGEIKYLENQYKQNKQKFRESYSLKRTAVLSICRFSVNDRVSFGTTKLDEKLYMYMSRQLEQKQFRVISVIKESIRLDSQANSIPEHSQHRQVIRR